MSDITKSSTQKKNQIPQTKNDTKTTNNSYLPKFRPGYIVMIPAISLVLAGFLFPKNSKSANSTAHPLDIANLQDINASINGEISNIDVENNDDNSDNTSNNSGTQDVSDNTKTEYTIRETGSSSNVTIKSSTTIRSSSNDQETLPSETIDSSVSVNGQQINLPTEKRFSEKYETEDSKVRLRGKNDNNGNSSIDISIDSN
jgi:hypothetical protein